MLLIQLSFAVLAMYPRLLFKLTRVLKLQFLAPAATVQCSLISLSIALIASAISVAAAPGLSLTLAGPGAVDGVQNLKVVATVTNTGTDSLKLLKDPRSLLRGTPTHSFTITNVNGTSPAFTGIMVTGVAPSLGLSDSFDLDEICAVKGCTRQS